MIQFETSDVFFVSGGSSGIGRATALSLNALGATVICVGRDVEKLNETKISARVPKHLHVFERDLTENLFELPNWIRSLSKEYGKIRGAVLAAGVTETIPLQSFTDTQAKALFEINYFSQISLAKGITDRRVANKLGSSIVFISSITSFRPVQGILNYAASKGALNSAMRCIALETAKRNVRSNSILPGYVKTDMITKRHRGSGETLIDKIDSYYPLGIGNPKDVANMAVFLLSPMSSWITGQSFVVDGGGSLVSNH